MSRRARLAFLLVAFSLVALLVPGLPRAHAAGELTVELRGLAPAVLTGPSDVTLNVRVTNNTDAPIAEPVAEVRLQTWTPVARNRLDDWLVGKDDTATTPLLDSTLDALAPGETRDVTLVVPSANLPALSRGPRGILVRVSPASLGDGAGDTSREGSTPPSGIDRSYLINWPDSSLPPGKFLVLGTVAASSRDIAAAPDSAAASEQLSKSATALSDAGVQLAGDPALDNPPVRTPLSLPSGDPDISFLAGSQSGRDILSRATSGASATPMLWWPTSATANALAARPKDAILVVGDDEAKAKAGTYYTPSGIATVQGAPALVFDTRMSSHLAASGNDIAHRQALLAHAAAAIRERPNDPRTFVLAVPRDADTTVVAERLAALTGAPFSVPGLVPSVSGDAWAPTDTEPETRWQLEEIADPADPSRTLTQLAEAEKKARAVATLTSSPTEFTNALEVMSRHLVSAAFTNKPNARGDILTAIEDRAARLSRAITVETPSSLLLISDQPDIPIYLHSKLTAPANVVVDLVAQDPRLQTPGTVKATLEPGTRTAVAMPVNAVGSGDLKVRIQVSSESGEPIASSDVFDVRVRADWENVGTGVAAGLLALLVIGGIIRTIRRNRRHGVRGRQLDPAGN